MRGAFTLGGGRISELFYLELLSLSLDLELLVDPERIDGSSRFLYRVPILFKTFSSKMLFSF